MAPPRTKTYPARVLVLRKRKLSETDLILSMLAGDGSLIEAVAKGARKPTNSFATRLDLFCESEVLMARGRNLDITSEARLLDGHDALRSNVLATYAASPILDCIASTALPNLPVEHLFDMATSALSHIEIAADEEMPAFTAAFLIKLFALLGVRPQLDTCISCGANVVAGASGMIDFSFLEGGVLCSDCATKHDRVRLEARTLGWARVLLGSTFDQILEQHVAPDASFAVLHFAHRWLRDTQSINSKALNQLLSCGLF